MNFIVTIAIVCILVMVRVATSQPNDVDPCSWQSKTQPAPLKGQQGTSVNDAYWFRHLSDVDKQRQTNQFVFAIKNNHSVNYLPAEWLRGNGQPQISFTRISPDGCGANDFESSQPSREDSKGVINYAPAKQKAKDAPLYEIAATSNQEKMPPKLKSRIIADVQEEDKRKYRVSLQFTTVTEGGRYFAYTVTNSGSKDHLFVIPAFSRAWEKMGKITESKYRSRWTTSGSAFVARANNEPQEHAVTLGSARPVEEILAQVQVLSNEGKPIGTGRITLYLPRPAE